MKPNRYKIADINEEYNFELNHIEPAEVVKILKDLLQDKIVHFVYKRKDGTERDAYGTTNPTIIDRRKQATGNGAAKNYSPLNVRYFDVDANGWRMCKGENVIKILDDTKEKPVLTWDIIDEFDEYIDTLLDDDEGTYTVKEIVNGFIVQTGYMKDGLIQELTKYLIDNYDVDLYNNTLKGMKTVNDSEEVSESENYRVMTYNKLKMLFEHGR